MSTNPYLYISCIILYYETSTVEKSISVASDHLTLARLSKSTISPIQHIHFGFTLWSLTIYYIRSCLVCENWMKPVKAHSLNFVARARAHGTPNTSRPEEEEPRILLVATETHLILDRFPIVIYCFTVIDTATIKLADTLTFHGSNALGSRRVPRAESNMCCLEIESSMCEDYSMSVMGFWFICYLCVKSLLSVFRNCGGCLITYIKNYEAEEEEKCSIVCYY